MPKNTHKSGFVHFIKNPWNIILSLVLIVFVGTATLAQVGYIGVSDISQIDSISGCSAFGTPNITFPNGEYLGEVCVNLLPAGSGFETKEILSPDNGRIYEVTNLDDINKRYIQFAYTNSNGDRARPDGVVEGDFKAFRDQWGRGNDRNTQDGLTNMQDLYDVCVIGEDNTTPNADGETNNVWGCDDPLNACDNQTTMTDSRDSQSYNIAAIGNQCWFQENLNVGREMEMLSSTDGGNNRLYDDGGYFDMGEFYLYRDAHLSRRAWPNASRSI